MVKRPRYSLPNGKFDPKLLDLMPVLSPTSNFAHWATNLKRTLDAVNTQWHQVLTGAWAKPTAAHGRLNRDQLNSLNEWLAVSAHIMKLINLRVDSTIKADLYNIFDARDAYVFLRNTCGSQIDSTGFDLYKSWMAIEYTSGTPVKFVIKWQSALHELNESNPRYKIPSLHVCYQFLRAVEANPESCVWTKQTCLHKNCSSVLDLEVLIQEFLEFENLRLGYHSDGN